MAALPGQSLGGLSFGGGRAQDHAHSFELLGKVSTQRHAIESLELFNRSSCFGSPHAVRFDRDAADFTHDLIERDLQQLDIFVGYERPIAIHRRQGFGLEFRQVRLVKERLCLCGQLLWRPQAAGATAATHCVIGSTAT